MRQICASGLPNPARFALHLFVCGRGGLKKFAAEMSGTLRKSSELENCELSIDDSAPERFCDEFRLEKRDRKLAPKQLCEEFRAGVDDACASNLNPCAENAEAQSS